MRIKFMLLSHLITFLIGIIMYTGHYTSLSQSSKDTGRICDNNDSSNFVDVSEDDDKSLGRCRRHYG